MLIEQMNISMSPQMARFIRDKVACGDYASADDVVSDAVCRLQAQVESEQAQIRLSVQQGLQDIESGRFDEYDADGLRDLAKELVAHSVARQSARALSK